MSSFLAINAKGGENIKPKAKGPHHHFKNFAIKLQFIFGNLPIGIHASLVLRKQNFNWYPNNGNLFNWYL
jgi:hypothetical protein